MNKKQVLSLTGKKKYPLSPRANSLKRQIIRQVFGACVDTINKHGPIDYERIGSVIARFVHQGIFKNMR